MTVDGTPIEDVKVCTEGDQLRWRGMVPIHPLGGPEPVVILMHGDQLLAIPERCPHQGNSLLHAHVDEGGYIRCQHHGERFPLFGQGGLARTVTREHGAFYLQSQRPEPTDASLEEASLQELQQELSALRQANLAQQKKMHVTLEQMDGMLQEVERGKQSIEQQSLDLRQLKDLMGRINDALNDVLLVTGPRGHIRMANQQALKILGCTLDAVEGLTLDQLCQEQQIRDLKEKLAIPEGSVRPVLYEAIYRHADFEEEMCFVQRSVEAAVSPPFLVRGSILFSDQGKEEGLILLASDISNVKRREMLRRQRDTEQNLALVQGALDNLGQGVALFDKSRQLQLWNTLFTDLLALPTSLCRKGVAFDALLAWLWQRQGKTAQAGDHPWRKEAERWFAQGHWQGEVTLLDGRILALTIRPMPEGGFNLVLRDITSKRLQEEKIRKLSYAVEQSPTEIVITDTEGIIDYVNPTFCHHSGYSLEEAVGMKSSLVRSGKMSEAFYEDLWKTITSGQNWHGEVLNKTKDGRELWQLMAISPMRNEQGEITHYLAIKEDITGIKKAEQRLAHMATHDSLTGLPNRSYFNERLIMVLNECREQQQRASLLFFDLDHFKDVNDTLGHDVGDKLLQAVSHRVSDCLREGDLVARFGGDEFAIIQRNLSARQDAGHLAERVQHALTQPFREDGALIHSGCSIGIAMIPEDGDHPDIILKNADMAMYRSKAARDGQYRYFDQSISDEVQQRRALEYDLRQALEQHQFSLVFQPKFTLLTGQVSGLEALIRWYHPDKGFISPATFIPLAEQTGLILPIGRWVLEQCCEQLQLWKKAGFVLPQVSINISAVQLKQEPLTPLLKELLDRYELSADLIELEITETALLENLQQGKAQLLALRAEGLSIALDDFGVGYSSLSYLTALPIDKVKIDKSFIDDVAVENEHAAVCQAIIQLCHNLGKQVVAEGVEVPEQSQLLKKWGCPEVQGYLYAKPEQRAAVEARLKRVGAL
ncbi:EAL domain-containing protein [Magnetococcus sp. PR-3]|uniref:EAL domain-containing protein n=1 Tax=Magnetococcus sp. PR-3 TaxID=3120355 RepID=UPI002FCE0BF1